MGHPGGNAVQQGQILIVKLERPRQTDFRLAGQIGDGKVAHLSVGHQHAMALEGWRNARGFVVDGDVALRCCLQVRVRKGDGRGIGHCQPVEHIALGIGDSSSHTIGTGNEC